MGREVTVSHGFSFRAIFGGGQKSTSSLDSQGVKKALRSEKPKVLQQAKYKGHGLVTKNRILKLERFERNVTTKTPRSSTQTHVTALDTDKLSHKKVAPPKTQPTTAPLTGPIGTAPTTVPTTTVPVPTFGEQLKGFKDGVDKMKGQVDKLRDNQPDQLLTKKEQRRAEVALSKERTTVKSGIDKGIGEVTKALTDKNTGLKTAEGKLKQEQGNLKQAESDLQKAQDELAQAKLDLVAANEKGPKIDGEAEKLTETIKGLEETIKTQTAKIKELKETTIPKLTGEIDTAKNEIGQLKAVRREMIQLTIESDFGGLHQLNKLKLADVAGPLGKLYHDANQAAVDKQQKVFYDKSPEKSDIDFLNAHLGVQQGQAGETYEITRMIEAYNSGAQVITRDDGTTLNHQEFAQYLEGFALKLDALSNEGMSEQAANASKALRDVATLINGRFELNAAVDHFEALLQEAPTFPLSSAMQVISAALPHSREFGNGINPRNLEAAAASVAHFAEAISRGETAPMLHGIDPKFDQAVLPLKQSAGGEIAVSKLREERLRGPLPTDAQLKLLDKITPDYDPQTGFRGKVALTGAEQQDLLDLLGEQGPVSTDPNDVMFVEARKVLGQAREDIRLAEEGGDAGAVRLRAERDKGPIASNELLALFDKSRLTKEDLTEIAKETTPDAKARKTDEILKGKLTDKDKAAIRQYASDNNLVLTEDQAIDQVLGDKRGIDAARESGRQAVALRHQLTLMDKRLSGLVTIRKSYWPSLWGKGAWYTPNKWGSGEQVSTSLVGVKLDAQFMKGLHKTGNAGSGKEVAIMIARFAYLQEQTVMQEQRALGLHVGHEVNAGKNIDPTQPLKHLGISNKDLRDIGLTQDEIDNDLGPTVQKMVQNLVRQGVGSLEQIEDVTTALTDVSKIVMRSELAQDNIIAYEQGQSRIQGEHLLNDILTDAVMRETVDPQTGKSKVPDRHEALTVTSDKVVEHFKALNKDLQETIAKDPGGMDGLKQESVAYKQSESDIAGIYHDHISIEKEVEARRDVLVQANKDFGLKIDTSDPRGLMSAKFVLIALDAQAAIDGTPKPTGDKLKRLTAARDEALGHLKGFDTTRMHTPWFKPGRETPTIDTLIEKFSDFEALKAKHPDKLPITDQVKRELALQELRNVSEAIVYIRDTGPKGIQQLEDELSALGTKIEETVAKRRDAHPIEMAHVNTMIRAAVLAEWRNAKTDLGIKDGDVTEVFDPSSKGTREKIEKTLSSWGLEVEAFTPEIDAVLFSRMNQDDIAQWRTEIEFSKDMQKHMKDDRPIFSMERLIGRRVMNTETREALLGLLQGLQEGDKLDLKAGQRVTLDSGKIPVEPTGLAGIRARLAGAHIGQFEVEMGSDGIKLHVRTGGEVKGNVDAVVGKKFGKDQGLGGNMEARLEASAGLEGTGSHLTGMTITFDKTPEGRQALVDLVAKMIDGDKEKPITVKDWQSAIDVGYTYENRAKGGVGFRGDARAVFGAKIDPDKGTSSKLDDELLGVGVSAGISGGVAIGGKWVGTDSHNQVTRKGEVEISTTIGVNAGVYTQFFNLLNMGTGTGAQNTGGQTAVDSRFGKDEHDKSLMNISSVVGNQDLLNVGISNTTTSVRKWKLVTTPEGYYTGGEKVRQSSGKSGLVASFADCMGSPQMKDIIKSGSEPPGTNLTEKQLAKQKEHATFVKDLETFMKLKGPDDQIAVKYSPKPEILEQANALVTLAIEADKSGHPDKAKYFREKAEKLMLRDDSYFPKEVGLISTDIRKQETSMLNGRWLKWDTFSDGKSEHRGVVLGIPAP